MCGRFFNHLTNMHRWASLLQDWPAQGALSFNIPPTTLVPIIAQSGVLNARWGLIPSWAKTSENKFATHNARSETLTQKPTFRNAWQRGNSCLVPAGGYFEWRQENGIKQPYVLHKEGDMLMMAGLWESWQGQISFTIITEQARDAAKDIHQRMPLLLDPNSADRWLTCDTQPPLPRTAVCETLSYYRVSTQVNNARADDKALLIPSRDAPSRDTPSGDEDE